MKSKFTNTRRAFATCKRSVDDLPVKAGQALTPSEMYKLASQGIPVSGSNLPFVDGVKNPSWDVPLENTRGVDVADLWVVQQEAKAKIVRAHREDREKYD